MSELKKCASHYNMENQLLDTNESWKKICSVCGKTTQEMFRDVNDIDPTHRVSQQPHGESTLHCNACGRYVTPTNWDGEQVCPYHQRTRYSQDGEPIQMWEEFNQDGEEY